MSGYILNLPEDEGVVVSGQAARRLVEGGDGDAALLYIAVLRNRGNMDEGKLAGQLGWPEGRLRQALGSLVRQGLAAPPAREAAADDPPRREEDRTEYTRADMARALEGAEFAGLTSAVEEKLGKKLTTPDLAVLLGLYDHLGLPADVIFLLVGFCAERTAARYGPGRRPTLRQIEKEGYTWARLGLMNQESAAGYIKKCQRRREALPQLMSLLRLGDRAPSPGEEAYLLSWNDMGFENEVIELAYDKTILKCKELKWPYMNKILCSWHQKGLHTLAEVKAGDRPAGVKTGSGAPPRRAPGPEEQAAVRADMERMERYRQQLRREKEGN